MNPFDLKGRVAVVTGGNGGIGLGMARGMAAAGAAIVVAARNREKSARAVKELEGLGARAIAIDVDVTDEASVNALVRAATERWGRLDVLVNNAGTNIRKQLQDLTLAEWHQVIDTNLTSAFLASRAVHPLMKSQGGGKIINIGSMMSLFGASYAPAYGASKGGMVQLTKAMAAAWARDNIQVNAVLPGWIDSELTINARREVPGLHDSVLARTPAKRWGVGDDLSGVAVFLASAASDFVTGTAIPVDGGFSAQG
ncbi:MAG TPA: glucose 1-dehydrogenase [Candidatus Methylomirabilis sp.]|nr:glucose 1-dehydrogenase [Candidatus Methylomirabilis sp.]